MRWEYMREEEFAPLIERAHGVCALVVGCLEKHGQHLPVGTDTLEGSKVLDLASEREEICIFPDVYFGDLQANRAKPVSEGFPYGFVAFSAELLLQMMREICDEIGRNGFTKILICNTHGGNCAFLANFIRAVRAERKPYDVFLFTDGSIKPRDVLAAITERGRDAFPAITDSDVAYLEDFVARSKVDGHAGFNETARIMSGFPELVRMDRCEAESGLSVGVSDPLTEVGLQWGAAWSVNFPNAYAGHAPTGLTPAIADAVLELHVDRLVRAIRVLKDDSIVQPILSAALRPPREV